MKPFSKSVLLTAALVGAAMLGAPASARAALQIFLQFDGNAPVMVGTAANFTAVSFTGNFGATGIGGSEFTVNVHGASSDNGSVLSDLLSSTTSVTNNSAATHTLRLFATQNDYTLPAGSPLHMESGLGGSVNTPTVTLTGIFQAWIDQANALLGQPATGTNGLQNAVLNGTTFDTGSAEGNFARSGNYSLTSVANFQLTAGAKANFSDHVNVTSVGVPAPAGIVLALTGLPFLTWLRRRKVTT
jgi:hypothetical protein